jgi:hypothetical protein
VVNRALRKVVMLYRNMKVVIWLNSEALNCNYTIMRYL